MAPQQKEEQFPPEIMNKPKTYCRFNCPVSRSSHSFKGFELLSCWKRVASWELQRVEKMVKTKKLQKYQRLDREIWGLKISLKTSFPAILILAASLLSNCVCFSLPKTRFQAWDSASQGFPLCLIFFNFCRLFPIDLRRKSICMHSG